MKHKKLDVSLRSILAAPIVLGLAACAVGPDFHEPAAPDVTRYTTTDPG